MLGWINCCIEELVLSRFSLDAWHKIKEKAGCTVEDGQWVRHKVYTDAETVALVMAASEVLGLTSEQVLEAFGKFFHEFTLAQGYSNLLDCQGSTLKLWLSNVNALHDHLEGSMPPGFTKPVFWCEDEEGSNGTAILLHYFSKRGSLLAPVVVGVVKEVAVHHFDVEIVMDRLSTQGESGSKFSSWRITSKDPGESWKLSSSTEEDETPTPLSPRKAPRPSPRAGGGGCPFSLAVKDMTERSRPGSPSVSAATAASPVRGAVGGVTKPPSIDTAALPPPPTTTPNSGISIDSSTMKTMFPYHIVVDEDFTVVQVGCSLGDLISVPAEVLESGAKNVSEVLEIVKPPCCQFAWHSIRKLQEQIFYMESLGEKRNGGRVKLKGNVITISTSPFRAMFSLSPDVKNMNDMKKMNLTLSDLPLISFQRESVFLGEHIASEVKNAHQLDLLSKQLDHEKKMSNELLSMMLPGKVCDDLRSGKSVEPEHFDRVTIFFSDIVGFTNISSTLSPKGVVDMLNDLYTVMDHVAAKFGLYKVETIGDVSAAQRGIYYMRHVQTNTPPPHFFRRRTWCALVCPRDRATTPETWLTLPSPFAMLLGTSLAPWMGSQSTLGLASTPDRAWPELLVT
jgi:hypothetical protein